MKNQISHLVFVIISTTILASCISPASVTEMQPTSPPDTPKPIPTETPGICPPYYSEPEEVIRLNLPSDLYGMVPADFNDDGLPDVLIYRGFNQTRNAAPVEILLNDGQGNFTLGATQIFGESVPSTVAPREVILADFNGDGRSDIFVADHGMDASPAPGAFNSLALSAPDGKMVDASVTWQNLTDFTHSAATADIDMDGDIDLYVGNIWGEAMIQPAIYLNTDNAGGFVQTKGRLPFPLEDMDFGAFTTSEFADVNNDTFPDLILGDAGDDLTGGTDSYVLLNDGRGYFTYLENAIPPKPWAETNTALDIDVADINDDGYQDIFILFTKQEYQGRYIQVLVNNQDGTFTDETETRLPQSENNKPWFQWVQLLDFNTDGQLDIVTIPSMGDQNPAFYINKGDGYFQPLTHHFNFNAEFFVFLDFDQDGFLDVLWATTYPSEVYYINRSLGCPIFDQ